MSLATKVVDNPYICGILLGFSGDLSPLANTQLFQKFFDTSVSNPGIETIYNTSSKALFTEKSQNSRAGISYTQQLSFSLPVGSLAKSEVIDKIHRLQYVAIKLDNSRYILIGRNDSKKNTAPKTTYNADERIANFQVETSSIFPAGYSQLEALPGFPFLIPVNL